MGSDWISEILVVLARWLVRVVVSIILGLLSTVLAYNFVTDLGAYRLSMIGMTIAILAYSFLTWLNERAESTEEARKVERELWLRPSIGEVAFGVACDVVVLVILAVPTLAIWWWFYWLLPDWTIHQGIRGLSGLGVAIEPTIQVHFGGICIWFGLLFWGVNVVLQEDRAFEGY